MARRGNHIMHGAEVGLYIVLAVLVLVALWYFTNQGLPNLAAWADQKGSNFAGGVSSGLDNLAQNGGALSLVANSVSGPVNSWLSGLSYDLTTFDNNMNPVGS